MNIYFTCFISARKHRIAEYICRWYSFLRCQSTKQLRKEKPTLPCLPFLSEKILLWFIYFSVLMSARTSYNWFQRDEMVLRGGLSLYDRWNLSLQLLWIIPSNTRLCHWTVTLQCVASTKFYVDKFVVSSRLIWQIKTAKIYFETVFVLISW